MEKARGGRGTRLGSQALDALNFGDIGASQARSRTSAALKTLICFEPSSPSLVRSIPNVSNRPVLPTAVNRSARLSRSRMSQPKPKQRRQISAPTRPAT